VQRGGRSVFDLKERVGALERDTGVIERRGGGGGGGGGGGTATDGGRKTSLRVH